MILLASNLLASLYCLFLFFFRYINLWECKNNILYFGLQFQAVVQTKWSDVFYLLMQKLVTTLWNLINRTSWINNKRPEFSNGDSERDKVIIFVAIMRINIFHINSIRTSVAIWTDAVQSCRWRNTNFQFRNIRIRW